MAVCWLLYRVTVSCFSNQYLHGCIRETRKQQNQFLQWKRYDGSGEADYCDLQLEVVYLNSLCHRHPFSLSPFKIQISLQDAEISILKYSWELSELGLYIWGAEQVLYQQEALGIKQTFSVANQQCQIFFFISKYNAVVFSSWLNILRAVSEQFLLCF